MAVRIGNIHEIGFGRVAILGVPDGALLWNGSPLMWKGAYLVYP